MICRFSLGDTEVPFSLQSCSKPFTYAICLNELGSEVGPSAGAQSIVRGHIGDNICQRNEIFKQKLFLQKIKRVNWSSRFLNKESHCIFKSGKCSCPEKLLLFFSKFRQQFFPSLTVKPESEKFWGKFFDENHQQAAIFLREMVYQRTIYSARTKTSAFQFRHKKEHLEAISNWKQYQIVQKPCFSHIIS